MLDSWQARITWRSAVAVGAALGLSATQLACKDSGDDGAAETSQSSATNNNPEALPATATNPRLPPTPPSGPTASVFDGTGGDDSKGDMTGVAGMGGPGGGPAPTGGPGPMDMDAGGLPDGGLSDGGGPDGGLPDGGLADAGPIPDAGGPDPAPMPTGCTGKPGMFRGQSVQTLMAGGLNRRFIYYAPESLDPNVPVPLVFVMHGYLMNGEQMAQTTGFEEIADREGFIAIFPDGQGDRAEQPGLEAPWNVGQDVCPSSLLGITPMATGDDQSFIDAMLEFAGDDQCLDEDHIFMTGFSMGGYFSNESSCVRSDLAAVAPHSGGSHELSGCTGTVKPVMLLHFEQDGLISFDCGNGALDRHLARNGCDAAVSETRMVSGGVCEYYQGCDDGAQVAMCTFQAPTDTSDEVFLGHGWSGGYAGDPVISTFSIPETADASELVWEFFTEYAW